MARDARSSQVGCTFQLQLEKLGAEMLKRETSRRAAFCEHQALEVGPAGSARYCPAISREGGERWRPPKPPFPSQQTLVSQTTDLKPQLSGFSWSAVCKSWELPAARRQAGQRLRMQPLPCAGDGRAGKTESKRLIHQKFPSPSRYQRGLKALEKDGSGTRPRAPAIQDTRT